jgi:predicted phosphoribosyltransferase
MMLSVHPYRDRIEAGQTLARHLAHYAGRVDTLVLALPRGGVPIAVEVAEYLHAPMDTFMVRKLTLPHDPGRALGAIASDGVIVLDDDTIKANGVTPDELTAIVSRETAELDRRQRLYRGRLPLPTISGRVVIVVDDGVLTGVSMHAAVIALHRQQPAWLVVAIPVGSVEACDELAKEVHEVVCPLRPEPLESVGLWYDHFSVLDDEEVRACLRHASPLPRS